MKEYDVITVGAGPAALSCAIYLCRGGKSVLCISNGKSALEGDMKIENYFGFGSISGSELLKIGTEQAEKLGAEIKNGEVVGVQMGQSGYTVFTSDGEYRCKKLLIATGRTQSVPKIDGLDGFIGRGVSFCAVCDGFLYRNKKIAVLGNGVYAKHECEVLMQMGCGVTLFTNGKELDGIDFPFVIKDKIASLSGDERINAVCLENGEKIEISAFFVAEGTAGATDLARKIGIFTSDDGKYIITDKNGRTNAPGVYAAGDCTGGFCQVATAVSSGALAANEILSELR